MNRSQLIKKVSERTGVDSKGVTDIVSVFFECISEALEQGGRAELRGFGTFDTKECGAYIGRNPLTGEKVKVMPKKKVVWRMGKELKERVNILE